MTKQIITQMCPNPKKIIDEQLRRQVDIWISTQLLVPVFQQVTQQTRQPIQRFSPFGAAI
ncbi:hypothetical protein LCGC14_0909400 [marine sediment metagenome]|uniref:Uncharacterized protein n=1 Tax=marine sediment metagenome TaxID=412755 RepID=A0A0F9S0X8_9ZZZZ